MDFSWLKTSHNIIMRFVKNTLTKDLTEYGIKRNNTYLETLKNVN